MALWQITIKQNFKCPESSRNYLSPQRNWFHTKVRNVLLCLLRKVHHDLSSQHSLLLWYDQLWPHLSISRSSRQHLCHWLRAGGWLRLRRRHIHEWERWLCCLCQLLMLWFRQNYIPRRCHLERRTVMVSRWRLLTYISKPMSVFTDLITVT